MNTFPLENKTCLITGGLGVFGLALTDLILKRGGRVWLTDLKSTEEGTKIIAGRFSERVGYSQLDVTSEAEFDGAFIMCAKEMGAVPDILFNLAGVVGEDRWEEVYDVNVKGVHRGIELAIKHMGLEGGNRGGLVVNISSFFGVTCRGEMVATPAYTASKHAIVALTRTYGVINHNLP